MKITDTKQLRAFLLGEMTKVANGETSTETAKGICNLAQQVYNTVNIELKTAMAVNKLGDTEIQPVKFDD